MRIHTIPSVKGYFDIKVVDILAGYNKTKNNITEIERARKIAKTLGIYTAARYLAMRNWSLDASRFVLLGV